jgi:hypothetical protein
MMNWERSGGKHSQHLIGETEKIMKTMSGLTG